LTNGLGPAVQVYINSNGGVLTSDMVTSMGNLACTLSNATINTLTSSGFT
jgi:hypothetical protein